MQRGNESRRLSDSLWRNEQNGLDKNGIRIKERADDDPGVRHETDRAVVTGKSGTPGVYVNHLSAGPNRH